MTKFGYNVYTLILTILNALYVPHRTRAEVMRTFQRDGARYFVVRLTTSELTIDNSFPDTNVAGAARRVSFIFA